MLNKQKTRAELLKVSSAAFSLVEMLTVLAIVGILSALIVPSFNTIVSSQRLTSASQLVVDQMNLARQAAITGNRPVEVRFYKIKDTKDFSRDGYSAIRSMVLEENGTAKPLTKVFFLPPAVRFVPPKDDPKADDNYSPLLNYPPNYPPSSPRTEILPMVGKNAQEGTIPYQSFEFRPDGSTSLRPVNGKWFVTLVLENQKPEADGLQANYSTIQVDAGDGRVRVFRPGV